MRLVIDTSVLISSLIKDSVTREILLLPFMKFYLPEYALEEIEIHKQCQRIIIEWQKTKIDFNPYKKWVDFWEED